MLGAGLLAAVCAVDPAPAREIPPADPTSLEAALARAAAEGGLVALLVVRAEDSDQSPLHALLRDPRVERALKGCVPMLLAADRQPAVASRYGVLRFPIAIFIDGSGREAGRSSSLDDAAAFAESAVQIVREAELRARTPRESAAREDPCDLLLRGQQALTGGQGLAGLELLERGLAALTDASPCLAAAVKARIALGDRSRESRRPLEAEAHYRSALELLASGAPRDAEARGARGRALLGLALSLRDSGRNAEGAKALRDALESGAETASLDGPARERVLYLLGQILEESGEAAEARERWEQCAREFPGSRYGERARRYLAERAGVSEGRASPSPVSR